ncbi:MAG: 3'-5' exonuclease domain-containing protein 2 [Deltaproteobacteria bacterium]|nr:3'-5' exonuclease domain-containing protein 2 [Deltaproteobacteria bacterium]
MQLAGENQTYIFQLKLIGPLEPLFAILADTAIIKAGVSLDFDLKELQKLEPFTPAGFKDLAALAKKAGLMNHGLRGMTAVLLKFRISKGAQRSNWAKPLLSRDQITYAATDAWVSRLLYEKLIWITKKNDIFLNSANSKSEFGGKNPTSPG